MKAVAWFFVIISVANADKPVALVAVRFETEAQCRSYEVQRIALPNTAAGCVPAGPQR